MATLHSSIHLGPESGFAYLPIPDDVAADLLKAGHKRVVMTVNGKAYRRALGTSKEVPGMFLYFGRDTFADMGLKAGEQAVFTLESDPDPEGYELPEELAAFLEQDEDAMRIWNTYTAGAQRSLCFQISFIKKDGKRFEKAEEMVRKIKAGTVTVNGKPPARR